MYDEAVLADFLEHHGVRGMKWGVRRQRRLDRFGEASNNSAKSARIRAVGGNVNPILNTGSARLGPIDLIRGHGITGGVNRKINRVNARNKRIKSGQATVGDMLRHVGSTRLSDIVPVRNKNVGKKNVLDNHKVVLATAGAVFAYKVLQRSAAKKVAKSA